ncbi:MAG TPA: hypothetical protein VMU06_24200 [Stellaceae bacterium]|nr:hypothetical protein [Stellaceae bacterium]
MRRSLAFLILVLALAAGAGSAGAAEAVKTRAAEHERYGRIAFDFKAPVEYEAKIEGNTLTVHFARALETDFGAISKYLDAYVSSVSLDASGTTVTAELKRAATLKTFTEGNTVAIDLVAERPQAAGTAETARPAPALRSAEHKGYRRLVFDWRQQVNYTVAETPGAFRLHFAREARIDLARVAQALPGTAPEAADEDGGTTLTLHLQPGEQIKHGRSGNGIVVDLYAAPAGAAPAAAAAKPASPAATPKPTAKSAAPREVVPPIELIEPTAGAGETVPLPQPESTSATALPGPFSDATSTAAPAPPGLSVLYASTSDTASLRFSWPKPVPAAVFRRAGVLWIVFGAEGRADLAEVRARAKAAVERIEQTADTGAAVFRLTTRRGLEPSLRRTGNDWVIDLKAQELRPEVAITAAADPARIVFEMGSPGEPIALADPEVGDRLIVVPTLEVGRGLPAESSVVEFSALVSAQGLVIRPAQAGISTRLVASGVEVAGPQGLALSGAADRARGTAGEATRLFDFAAWRGPEDASFLDRRSELERAVAAAPLARRSQPRLALAQFYFANLYAAEALGVIEAIERDDPGFAVDPVLRAMRGAAAFLTGDRDQAAQELMRPTLDNQPEVGLWRGALAAADGDWRTAARESMRGVTLLPGYPKALRNRLALTLAEALIRTDDADAAGALLRLVQKDAPSAGDRAMARYLEGLQAKVRGDLAAALEIWQEVARLDDRPSRARALEERTLALFQSGKIPRADAIQQLDALRFAWRGDGFEFDLLHQLGTLLIADGDYRRGLDALRQAATNYPRHPEVPLLREQMAAGFAQVFTGETAANASPLKALALFEEFKELLPEGAQGSAILRSLTDRLIAVDLLAEADRLLEDQATNRLTGPEKAHAATELAAIRLLDHRPDAALKALDIPLAGDVAPDLKRQRQQLRAHALTALGRTDEALSALADDYSRNADRIRADIYWKTQKWAEVARVFERVVDPPADDGKLDKKAARMVLDWAAALTLAGDRGGRERLRERFGIAMAASPYAQAFRLIAGDEGIAAAADPRERARHLADIVELQNLTSELRSSIAAEKPGAVN